MTQEPITNTNCIICGDCKDQLARIPAESVDLIYLDPPFFSGRNYEIIWKDGSERRSFEDTKFYTLVCGECGKVFPENHKFCVYCGASVTETTNKRLNDIEAYLQWLKLRLVECKRVLKDTGSIYCHLDWHAVHYVKVMMDEIFGMKNFQNEIVWHYGLGGSSPKRYSRKHGTILFYSKSDNMVFNPPMVKATSQKMKGKLKKADDVWDIPSINNMAKERLGYPTQKPESLLERIIKASSNPGDLILDPFCGCGTAIAVAQKFGRKWLGIDVSPTSCRLMTDRLRKVGYSIGESDIIDMPQTINELKDMEHFEFQNWVVQQLGGRQVHKKTGDRGIDGWTFEGNPIQVKQSEKVGNPTVRLFTQDIRDVDKDKGIIVALSFSKGAYDEVTHVFAKHGIKIELRCVEDMIGKE